MSWVSSITIISAGYKGLNIFRPPECLWICAGSLTNVIVYNSYFDWNHSTDTCGASALSQGLREARKQQHTWSASCRGLECWGQETVSMLVSTNQRGGAGWANRSLEQKASSGFKASGAGAGS